MVEGHTDSTLVAADAPFESNWELASLRATSIVRYLITQGVITVSYVKSSENLADPFTKGLPVDVFNKAMKGMGLKSIE